MLDTVPGICPDQWLVVAVHTDFPILGTDFKLMVWLIYVASWPHTCILYWFSASYDGLSSKHATGG